MYPGSAWSKNVIAEQSGVAESENIILLGGHHDSVTGSDPLNNAPGADDNASGTAAVLEIARALKASGVQLDKTLQFATFAAEEQGLIGSYYNAQNARLNNRKINLMINFDMISNSPTIAGANFHLNYYTGSDYLVATALTLASSYSILNSQRGISNSGGSDSYSFWANGYPAIYFEEFTFSPYYHSPQDLITNVNIDYCTEIIKAAAAMMVYSSYVPDEIHNITILDQGDGNRLYMTWDPATGSTFSRYNISIGTQSGVYSRTISTTQPSIIIDSLISNQTYYIGISAMNSYGLESPIVEKSATPQTVPLSPLVQMITSTNRSISFQWTQNRERDLFGYNIYRTTSKNGSFIKIASTPLSLSQYTDFLINKGQYYYYNVTAVDSAFNESIQSNIVRSIASSFDQGICIVDATYHGDGSIGNPPEQPVTDFYNQALVKFNPKFYDIRTEGGLSFADLGAYSTIIWHNDGVGNVADDYPYRDTLRQYLIHGGKVLFAGYYPTRSFALATAGQQNFAPGAFVHEYLGIGRSEYYIFTLCNGAISNADLYPSLSIDTTKTLTSSQYHIGSIESIQPGLFAKKIYSYSTAYDSLSMQGKMKGFSVGVEIRTRSTNAITLSVPLYYMNADQVKNLLEYVVQTKFNEQPAVVKKESQIPEHFNLSQNYPNPFNPSTTLHYDLPRRSRIKISVFDLVGRAIRVLVDEERDAGIYSLTFDARTMEGKALPSGIYFCRLQTGTFIKTVKMALIR
jgi:hypothetical protein